MGQWRFANASDQLRLTFPGGVSLDLDYESTRYEDGKAFHKWQDVTFVQEYPLDEVLRCDVTPELSFYHPEVLTYEVSF